MVIKKVNKVSLAVFAASLTLGLAGPIAVLAATAPSLGATSPFGVVSQTFTNANTPPQTIINGSVCGTTVNIPLPLTITGGTPETPCAPLKGTDQGLALGVLNSQACTSITPAGGALNAALIGSNPVGTFPPGCYSITGAMTITSGTTVTLDATAPGGDGGNVWVFKSSGALTTGASTAGFPSVVLAHGASAANVFWAPVGAATLGANFALSATPTFVGTIIDDAGISLGHFAYLLGRALDFATTVTTDANTITVPASEGSINVVKTVVNDNGRTQTAADFPLFVNGVPVVSGASNLFAAPGTYTVTETSDTSSYGRSFSLDCAPDGVINLLPGDSKFCIITNNDTIPGSSNFGSGNNAANLLPVPPLIDVVKVPNPLALPAGPGPVTYTYTLRNIGTVAVTSITMVGDSCAPITLVSGDSNNDARLDANETWVYTCSTALSATHTNTVVATGWANGISAVDIASATVVVGIPLVSPLIHVTKIPSPLALSAGGGTVTYTESISNPGTVALSNVGLADDKCAPLKYISGDTNGNSLLDVSETWVYTCSSNLTQTTTNTATASGQGNGFTVRDFAIATVVVAPPVPGLPNTGIAPENKNLLWTILMPAGALAVLLLLYVIRKKHSA